MSKHDPFDGIYDDGQAGASDVATSPAQQAQVVSADETAVEDAPPASEVSNPEVYTRSRLERMKKAELQVAARERSLPTSGDRDDLIESIWSAQQAERSLP
jgi:hypothetical protein